MQPQQLSLWVKRGRHWTSRGSLLRGKTLQHHLKHSCMLWVVAGWYLTDWSCSLRMSISFIDFPSDQARRVPILRYVHWENDLSDRIIVISASTSAMNFASKPWASSSRANCIHTRKICKLKIGLYHQEMRLCPVSSKTYNKSSINGSNAIVSVTANINLNCQNGKTNTHAIVTNETSGLCTC